MKKGQDLKIREKLSKSYLQVIFIASISAIVGIGALLIMTSMYNNALTNYGFSQGDIGKAMTVFTGAQSNLRGAIGYDEEGIIKELKEDYYVKQDSFNTYLAEVEKSMVTKAGRDAYNQLLADLDGYWELSDELIEVMAKSKKICRHLHLPLQSGSSRLLKIMNRHYDKEQYLALAEKIRKAVPDISLTTDIIVGFPGETEEDFQETLDVVRKVRYDSAFTFIYSKRTGTPAAVMEDQIPEDVVKDRFNRLLHEVQTISAEQCAIHEGTVQTVLVECVNEHDNHLMTGRMSNNLLVHFPGDESLIGQLVDVHLDECKGFYYMGRLIED